ncbi:nitroreductase family deazaflavin-dependent oxidoreductase [Streptomyces sp. CA-210063]|uniref:nitroreductase family deazaflavin-dependent oxidoreductase n=1 Tax=Streptomyces sp. CA-210063 TaxID=2801029 RepID=UPI00214B7B7D|nr:nitroreductase family deazaflavin-dependent oxidoreductase [Streptomyces sp. CA-210063]UUU29380.1 nitroreductase family deazaflavin-dependent oxidoreductase [Streptomyces sp. CA-210063]
MEETIDLNQPGNVSSDAWNSAVIAEFRANGGNVGGVYKGLSLILVHHIGVRSGIERTTPLVPFCQDDRLFVFASRAGADEHPAWYYNLVAHPTTIVEFGTDTFPVVARALTGAERDEIYAKQSAVQPAYAEFQRQTSRVIPVIELQRTQ